MDNDATFAKIVTSPPVPVTSTSSRADGDDFDDLITLARIQSGTYTQVNGGGPGTRSLHSNSRSQPQVYVNSSIRSDQGRRSTHRRQADQAPTTTPRVTRSDANDQVIIGQGTNGRNQSSTKRRKPVGVFVSRLHPQTTAADVDAHLRDESGHIVKSERLATKCDTYASFCVRCGDAIAQNLLDPNFWPKGTMVKRFFE